jgi:hypothetical protein
MPPRATNLHTPALGLPLEAEEEEVQDMTSRRAQLAVGAWAGPRTLAKREKMLMSSSARAKRDKRHAEAQQLQAVLLKYKQLGGEFLFPSHHSPTVIILFSLICVQLPPPRPLFAPAHLVGPHPHSRSRVRSTALVLPPTPLTTCS